jgi:hypothetical protein
MLPVTFRFRRVLTLVLLGVATFGSIAPARTNVAADRPASFDPLRHMSVDQVAPGMTGYGLTVFHGDEPEAFGVEVISVERAFRPGGSVVWIRCTDERLQKTGPVQGMSGSPIYLYTGGEPGDRNRPARLIGAFALGYAWGKDAYVGVTPIEEMLAAGARAESPMGDRPELQPMRLTSRPAQGRIGRKLLNAAAGHQPNRSLGWRARLLAKLLDGADPKTIASQPTDLPITQPEQPATTPGAQPIPLTLAVKLPSHAKQLAPLLQQYGLQAVAGATGNPPPWINPDTIEPQPGGALSVPLMLGALDLAAVGTITDVLPDGTVLAFGHAFDGWGPTKLPMATGYVHFIQPSLASSFKLGGTARVFGTVVNDEATAIVGKPDKTAPLTPSTVHLRWADSGREQAFEYQLAEHPMYTPLFAAYSSAASVAAESELPLHSTMTLRAELEFEDDQIIEVDAIMPDAQSMDLFWQLLPPVAILSDNEFETLRLERIATQIEIEHTNLIANITDVTLNQRVYRPGETVVAYVTLQPFRGEPIVRQLRVELPENLIEHTYPLVIGGPETAMMVQLESRPHLFRITSIEQLIRIVRLFYSMRSNAIYATLMLDDEVQMAVGDTEMPRLPSAQAHMLRGAASTRATPYIQTLEFSQPIDWVISGAVTLPVNVETDRSRRQP